MSETVQYENEGGLTQKDRENMDQALWIVENELSPADLDALRLSKKMIQNGDHGDLPAIFSEADNSPELNTIMDHMLVMAEQYKDLSISENKKINEGFFDVHPIPQKVSKNHAVITYYSNQANYRTEADDSKTIIYDLNVQNRDWNGKEGISSLYNRYADSEVDMSMQCRYNKSGELENSWVDIQLRSGEKMGYSRYEMNEDGTWQRVPTKGEMMASKTSKEDQIGEVDLPALERRIEQRSLRVSDEKHDNFIAALEAVQKDKNNEGIGYESIEALSSKLLEVDIEKESEKREGLEKGQMKEIEMKSKKYNYIGNPVSKAGDNTIFTGEDPRDLSTWFSYDKSTGHMTRLFEEVKEENK